MQRIQSPSLVSPRQNARSISPLLAVVVVIWLLEIADFVLWSIDLDLYGIHPRTLIGLRNIIFAPFLHVGFGHLLLNTIPFIFLGLLILLRGQQEFIASSVIGGTVSGLGVWLFGGSNTVHLGLSGVIFAYLGFLLLRAVFERSLQSLVIAVIAGFFYGGMIWGILPLQTGVSWLGHLFGFIGGGLAAYLKASTRG